MRSLQPSNLRTRRHVALLTGASAVALSLMGGSADARSLNGGSSGVAAPAIASEAAALAAQQAVGAVKQSQESLARAARAIQDMQAVQNAARAAAAARETSLTAPVSVPNGLGAGGLMPVGGLSTTPPPSWVNANAPTQSADASGQTQVNIRQTNQQAILNWTSFNVGARTTLTFDQQGNASWVALNRVNGGTAPSQILGNIKADGQVYVINPNGIIFGGNSQINLGALIASTAGITDDQFRDNGIYGQKSGNTIAASFTNAARGIVVEAGALIETRAPSDVKTGGGFVLMMGSEVSNAGTITTPKGQTILAVGRDFILRSGFSTDSNKFSTTNGSEIAPVIGNTSGVVTNTGAVWAQQGDITLAGRTLQQSGVLLSSTTVNQRGTIHLLNSASDTAGSVTLAAGSLTQIIPELDSTDTAQNSQRDALATLTLNPDAAGQFDNLSTLTDRRDQSRIEIVTGNLANFQNGSLTMAQGGQIAVSANNRVFAEQGAVLDVSGVQGAVRPMSANQVLVNVQGNELRDSPVNRDTGVLVSRDVWIDLRDLVYVAPGTGGYAGERYYTKGGLLEVGGYLANTKHTIGEWASVGGTITLSAKNDVIAQKGAVFNIAGGSVSYDGGWIYSTKIIGTDGRIYSFDNAPADMKFAALAGSFVRTHNVNGQVHDGLTEVWTTIFDRSSSRRWEDGYTVGRDAGRLNLSSPTPVFEADLVTDVIKGERQTSARAATLTDGYKQAQNAAPLEGTLGLGRYDAVGAPSGFYNSAVRFGDIAGITPGLSATSVLAADRANTAWFDAAYLNSLKLGGLDFGTLGTITFERAVTLADGGNVNLVAPVVDLRADITARGGSLTVDNFFRGDAVRGKDNALVLLKDGKSSITVRDGVTLDLRGLWVNLQDKPADINKQAYVNGGTVTLQSSHDVTLEKGGTIDVSSGAAVLANGKTKGGRGGDVTLIADEQGTGVVADGLLTVDGAIRAYGVSGGGTLKLESGTAVGIGGKIMANEGVLGAGETAQGDFVLAKDYLVKAGEALPGDYTFSSTVFMPGDRLTRSAVLQNVVLAADWTPPYAVSGRRYSVTVTRAGITTTEYVYYVFEGVPRTTFRAGDIISIPSNTIGVQLTGYVLPADAFPNGLPASQPFAKTLIAGTVMKDGAVLVAGTRLATGFTPMRAAEVKPFLQLESALFHSGFSNYDIVGRYSVTVASGAALDVAMPIYGMREGALDVASGADPAKALAVWTPPEWTADPRNAKLTQRGGASLSLRAVSSEAQPVASGAIKIGNGASIRVDSGQSITLQGLSFTIDGRLTAPGGKIDLTQPVEPNKSASAFATGPGGTPGLIWIGDNAVLDAAARAVTATDVNGRTFGVVGKAGSILIGGALDWEDLGFSITPTSFVVIRPGALLDASGTSAVIDIPAGGMQKAGTPLLVASDGGSIVVKAGHGLYLDGTMRAASGGGSAAGGTLGVALETLQYQTNSVSGDVLRHRELVIASVQGSSAVADAASLDAVRAKLVTGTARLGVDRIEAGGFDNLSLLVDGVLSFDGHVSLAMAQSMRLYTGTIGITDAAATNTRVELSAPYMRLAGVTRIAKDGYSLQAAATWVLGTPSQRASDAILHVSADLIDLRDRVSFGIQQAIKTDVNDYTLDRRGFATVDLLSRGDLRLLRAVAVASNGTRLSSPDNISLTAAQIYPVSGAIGRITAGYVTADTIRAGGVLDIHRYGETPDMPYSAFGGLYLTADIVNQGGVVRAPFGSITLGKEGVSDGVNLLPGSITSTSGAGLVVPYGGTFDGITFSYGGEALTLRGAGGIGLVTLNASHVSVQDSAVIDLSGGGELTGAGFIAGRGGSVNILATPLINANPGYGFSAKSNEVYAIVPSYHGGYAPVVAEAGSGLPAIGRQIDIPNGVPGLPAGTYTLMPANYALLPGAYRVELGRSISPTATGAVATGSGSYLIGATLGVANTDIRSSLPVQAIITAGTAVRTHSFYNEMGYNAFVLADAARAGVPRAAMTIDAQALNVVFAKPRTVDARSQFSFDGDFLADAAPGSDGYAGSVTLHGVSEIMAPGQVPTAGVAKASIYAHEISKLNAPRLVLNGSLGIGYGDQGRYAVITGDNETGIVLRSGAQLSAAEVIFAANGKASPNGMITIEEGASVSTIGRGKTSFDSRDGYTFIGLGVLMVSNGFIDLQQDEYRPDNGHEVAIKVGGCITANCSLTTTLASEGTIAVSTPGAFSLERNVSYGTRNLVLAVSAINLGSDASLAAAASAGQLPAGLALNGTLLNQLFAGNTAIGAPALETLALNARNSVNVFGSVDIDATKVGRLIFGSPAFYGYGASGDIATIRADEFVWTGLNAVPGAAIAGALGSGSLNIAANRVVFGYGPNSRPDTTVIDNRLALGFSDVSIAASQSVTSNNQSTLAVYGSRGAYDAATGYQYTGGNLTITTPLFTGAAGSSNAITAGGDLRILGGNGATGAGEALGGQLKLSGANVTLDTSVVLPSGRLTVNATGDLVLGANSRLDLAGRGVTLFDVTKYSWGGDLVLASSAGNIRQDAGSVIDLSAQYNRGGTMSVTALGSSAGHVALNGAVFGSASGVYDAGGTLVPYDAAEISVHAQTLSDFAGLNARLNASGVFGARRFLIKQGDLVVGDEVKARNVEITLDGGSLTVDGTVDASGYQVGSIRLAAMNDLTVNGRLDAHGTGMRFDSYGLIIDAPNRANVELTTKNGTLTLAGSASVDLRAGTDIAVGTGAGRNDGVARGTLVLNAPRSGTDDIKINVAGTPSVAGAKTIAVYGYRTYDNAQEALVPDVTGNKPQLITQAYLDGIHDDSWAFIEAARVNATLLGKLAGLGDYHLRPGVDIVSRITAGNPKGNLTIDGDLDLSGYRYGANAVQDPVPGSATYGFGEPGAINFRAAGNLNIRGTVTDGFAPPPATPSDTSAWRLVEGEIPYGGEITLPTAVSLAAGTVFKAGVVLNYNLPTGQAVLPAGTVLPVRAKLAAALTLSAGTVVDATIYNANGSVAYAAGTVLAANVTLTADMELGAGTVLRSAATVGPLSWPKGVPLPVDMAATMQLDLAAGSLIPSMTNVKLVGGVPVELRSTSGGKQGANWAIAPMLPAGTLSWDMQFTAGAEIGSADTRARNATKTGSIVLGDTHYVTHATPGGYVQLLGEAGADYLISAFGMPPGYSRDQLVGKTEAEVITIFGAFSWDDFGLPGFWTTPGNLIFGLTAAGATEVFNVGGVTAGVNTATDLIGKTKSQVLALYFVSSWDDFGLPTIWTPGQGYADAIALAPVTNVAGPSFSVVRTGTGNLSLSAANNITMSSVYGVYTAGTATSAAANYTLPRGMLSDNTLLGQSAPAEFTTAANSAYKAWYPEQGGNVLIAAGGDLTGDIYGAGRYRSNVLTGNWLWRQGTGTAAVSEAISTAWWINFGTYVPYKEPVGGLYDIPDLVGFTGIGALGGGNIAIRVDGQAGTITLRGPQVVSNANVRSQGLVVAVGSTGRVGSDGSLTLTGGGDIDMRVAGKLNPNLALTGSFDNQALPGALIDLRGTMHVNSESLGGIKLIYNGTKDSFDPRGGELYTAAQANARSGLVLVPGDATITIETRGDLVLAGAGDPGRSATPANSPFKVGSTSYSGGGQSWFSLWTDHTAINLLSAGGNLTPSTVASDNQSGSDGENRRSDSNLADQSIVYPAILRAAAVGGSIYYGVDALPNMRFDASQVYPFLTLAPSVHGALEMLAGNSIYAGQYGFSASGSSTSLPTPFNPAFMGYTGRPVVTNVTGTGSVDINGSLVPNALFAFGPNSAAAALVRAEDADPIRFYAGKGDIVGLYTGETLSFFGGRTVWYNASGPLVVRAGRDIVGAGLAPGSTASAMSGADSHGNLIVHTRSGDVSIVSAGRDIINANFDIAGPGVLDISAGRNVYQAEKGAITSIGPIATGDTRPGASVSLLAGVGTAGPDYDRFAALYLDPANLTAGGTPLADQIGKVAKAYEKELLAWLQQRYGFAGKDSEAQAYFKALAPEQRHIFLRTVYFAELTAGGREYNDDNSPRHGSYLRGREAIAALFPGRDAQDNIITRGGDITMFSGTYVGKDSQGNAVTKVRDGAVRTLFGGDIQMMATAGKIVVGVEGFVPGEKAGLVTQGAGNIQLYSQGSLLLGLSRMMTTFGGSILAWSAEGDINAGRGSKTTTIYTPPKRSYDKYGRAALAPQAPSAGAGIATLNPIPEVPPGDIDLIAPLGTIDAGEAGIRVSGNVNLAALQILNAANIQVQGSSSGIPTVQAPSITAALSSANATAASQQTPTPSQGSGNERPSVIIVEVLGYGGGSGETPAGSDDERRGNRQDQRTYNGNSAVQFVGAGTMDDEQRRRLIESGAL